MTPKVETKGLIAMGHALMKYPGTRRPAAFRAPVKTRSAQDFQKSPPASQSAANDNAASSGGWEPPGGWDTILELGSLLLPQTRLIRLLLRAYDAYRLIRDLQGDLAISKPNPVADGWTRIGNCGGDNIGPFNMGGWDTCSGLIDLATPRGVAKFGSVWYLNYGDRLIYWTTTGQPRAYVKGGSYRYVDPAVHPAAWPSGPIVRPRPLDWPQWGDDLPAPEITPDGVSWPDAIPVPGEPPEAITPGQQRNQPGHLPWSLVPLRVQRRDELSIAPSARLTEDEELRLRVRRVLSPADVWRALDRVVSSVPVVRTEVDAGSGRVVHSDTRHELRAPRRGERERKTRASSTTMRVITTAVGQITEGMDWVDAVWKAIPKHLRNKGFSSPVDKAREIWAKWAVLDPQRAVAEIVAMQIEDALIGRSAQGWRQVAQNAPFQRSIQSGEGYRRKAAQDAQRWLWEQAGRPDDFDLADVLYDLMKGMP